MKVFYIIVFMYLLPKTRENNKHYCHQKLGFALDGWIGKNSISGDKEGGLQSLGKKRYLVCYVKSFVMVNAPVES